ncbi:MAG: hypothetical protein HC880_05500 [Bacteroidia bacterium]|nr:hypothetical protein [Bacteroidia bacterium]
MLPPGANRVFFARNHDTSWFYKFGGYTPAFLNLDAIHALCTIPEVFAGDKQGNKGAENPDDRPEIWNFYRKLFKLRKILPEFTQGKLCLNGVKTDQANVFSALRIGSEKIYLILISFNEQPTPVKIEMDTQSWAGPDVLNRYDPIREMRTPLDNLDKLILEPYQILVIESMAINKP